MKKLLACSLFFAVSTTADPKLPPGFHLDVFARDLGTPRTVLALEDGTVLVSRPDMNDVLALRDRDGDGRADSLRTAIASIEHAHGLAMRGRVLYVAGVRKIVAAERLPDGSFAEPREIVADLPDGGQHPNRAIGVGPDGKLYVAIGSSCSDCEETNPEHATLLQIDADGANRRIYARGLRDTAGFDWDPQTGELWAGESGEINRIGDGLNYAQNARAAEPPVLQLKSSAPAGFVFYRGSQYPEEFRRIAFVIAGNEVLRVRLKEKAAEPFLSGFDGALAGATVAPDGALLVSDAKNGVIYRITYGESAPRPMMSSSEETTRAVLAKAFEVPNLKAPAAVLHDEEQDVYFVANKSAIARVSPDGKVTEPKFIDGLRSPKGMAIRGAELWIADVDHLRAFDRVSGSAIADINLWEHGAISLQHVAVGPDDLIYVTDSEVALKGGREQIRKGDGRIFRIDEAGDVEVIASGEELRSPSGIAWDGTRFLIAQAYGKEVLAWNPGTATKAVLRGPGAYDGLIVLPTGAVIVSSHHDGALYVAHTGGELRPLFTRKPSPAGIAFDRKRNRLLIAVEDGDRLEAWTLPPIEAPKRTSTIDGSAEMASRQ